MLSSSDWTSQQMRMWLAMVSIVLEGSLAQYLVREQAREYPNQSVAQKILPATLPFMVMGAALLRILGVYGSSIFN